ncbi:hypothetical protein DPMN_017441 [Dreissena polymorpha]|uniref:Uncharacterized protein n=1 Tax=Dreissena polymorpha TaxID=45954 RepID=A0A9D4S7B9_DREPO|nr:hypothetical protein DPMN_017441 [Dreissena polymorpha]
MVWKILNEIDENTAKLKVPYFTNEITKRTKTIAIKISENKSQGLTNFDEIISSSDMETGTSIQKQDMDDKVTSEAQHGEIPQQTHLTSQISVENQTETSEQLNKATELVNKPAETSEPKSETTVPDEKQSDTSQNKTAVPKTSDQHDDSSEEQNEPNPSAKPKTKKSGNSKQPKEEESSSQTSIENYEKYEYYKTLLEDKELSRKVLAKLIDTFCPKIPVIGKVCRYFLKKIFKQVNIEKVAIKE